MWSAGVEGGRQGGLGGLGSQGSHHMQDGRRWDVQSQ